MPYAQLTVFVSPSSPSTAGFAQPAGFGGGETCSPNSLLRPPQVGEEFAPSPLVGSTLEGIKVGVGSAVAFLMQSSVTVRSISGFCPSPAQSKALQFIAGNLL